MKYLIIGINKDNGDHQNPHEAIRAYIFNGSDGKLYYYRQDMVNKLLNGDLAYTHQDGYTDAKCEVRSNGHIEFLQTVSDGKYTNNLLFLPEYKIEE